MSVSPEIIGLVAALTAFAFIVRVAYGVQAEKNRKRQQRRDQESARMLAAILKQEQEKKRQMEMK